MSYDWLERELGQGGLFCPEKTISLSDSYDIKTEDTSPPPPVLLSNRISNCQNKNLCNEPI
jgi:hypothetical protein